MDVLVVADVTPHVLDPRDGVHGQPACESPPGAGVPADADDPFRTATPEARRAFENTDEWLPPASGTPTIRLVRRASSAAGAVRRRRVAARAPWSHVVRRGQMLRIVDLEGNQAVDFLLYAADDPRRALQRARTRWPRSATCSSTTGTVLRSNEGTPMMTHRRSTVRAPRHDRRRVLAESNTLRYGHHTKSPARLRRQLPPRARPRAAWASATSCRNINWFMNVPVEADGTLGIVDGISAPGLSVELRAEIDVIVVVSNCPQINNPCNGFDPTPVR